MSTLRQRKKDRTRTTLIEVSQKLFLDKGYDATTLEEISSAADVSVPTLLVYFESKERLALAPDYDALAEFRARVDDPEREALTVEVWRDHVITQAKLATSTGRVYRKYYDFLASSPALVRGTLALLQQYEDVIATGVAADFGSDPQTDLTTRLTATTLIFGNQSAVRAWIAGGGKTDLSTTCLSVIDFVIDRFPKPGSRLRPVRATRAR